MNLLESLKGVVNIKSQQLKNCIIREVEEKDKNEIIEIAIKAWQPIFTNFQSLLGDFIFYYEYPDWKKEKARQICDSFSSESATRILLAEVNGKISGFITYTIEKSKKVGIIGNNAVAPEFQGKGIAGVMYNNVIEEMKEQGMRYLRVRTGGDLSHLPARKAYEKIGFNKQIPWVDYFMEIST